MAPPRIASYSAGGKTGYGAVTDGGIVDLSARFAKDYPTLREVIAAGALQKLSDGAAKHSRLGHRQSYAACQALSK